MLHALDQAIERESEAAFDLLEALVAAPSPVGREQVVVTGFVGDIVRAHAELFQQEPAVAGLVLEQRHRRVAGADFHVLARKPRRRDGLQHRFALRVVRHCAEIAAVPAVQLPLDGDVERIAAHGHGSLGEGDVEAIVAHRDESGFVTGHHAPSLSK